MKARETKASSAAENVGTLMLLCGILALGLGGFLLLSLIAYAMVTGNLALGVVCGLLLSSPYILGVAWLFTLGTSLRTERVPTKAEELARASAQI
jgi:hypothetical protein